MSLMHSLGLFDLSADRASLLIIGRIPSSPSPGDFLGICCSFQFDSLAIFLHNEAIFLFFPVDSRRKADKKVFSCSDLVLCFLGVEIFFFGIVIFVRDLMRSGYFGMVCSA